MVRLDPSMNNITVIHLPGQPVLWPSPSPKDPEENENRLSDSNHDSGKSSLSDILSEGTAEDPREIMNQNVGVTGGQLAMLSEPKYFMDDDDPIVGPYSLMSVHENVIETVSSSHHLTTITIGERNASNDLNKKIMTSTKSFILNPPSDQITKIINHKSPELISPKLVSSWSSMNNLSTQSESYKPLMKNKQSQASIIDWEESFTKHKLEEKESDRVSTPSSFSSAYTVTEQELNTSDSSTNADTQSDSCCNCPHNCCHWSDESSTSNADVKEQQPKPGNNVNVSYIFINNDCTENIKEAALKLTDDDKAFLKRSFLIECRSRKNSVESSGSSDKASTCRDQRDKEDEELWVANEATYSTSFSDSIKHWLIPPHDCNKDIECEALQKHLLAVLSKQPSGVDVRETLVKAMATLMCPVGDQDSLQRKHFTNRQREVQESTTSSSCSSELKMKIDSVDLKKEEMKIWNKENEIKDVNMTSTMGNRPSKRFSFLIRSHSLKDNETPIPLSTATDNNKSQKVSRPVAVTGVSASDKAILDRLSQLNLDKSSSKGEKPRARLGQPLCNKCKEPVYTQELVRPTSELFFHVSCFKCFECGIKLNLGNFYRSKVEKSARIFCRTHLPAPDGRPNSFIQNKAESTKLDIVKCDSVGLRYF